MKFEPSERVPNVHVGGTAEGTDAWSPGFVAERVGRILWIGFLASSRLAGCVRVVVLLPEALRWLRPDLS